MAVRALGAQPEAQAGRAWRVTVSRPDPPSPWYSPGAGSTLAGLLTFTRIQSAAAHAMAAARATGEGFKTGFSEGGLP